LGGSQRRKVGGSENQKIESPGCGFLGFDVVVAGGLARIFWIHAYGDNAILDLAPQIFSQVVAGIYQMVESWSGILGV